MAVFAAAVVVVEIPAAAETAWQTDLAEAVVVGIAAGQTAAAAVEAAGGERQRVVFFWDQTGLGAWDQAC